MNNIQPTVGHISAEEGQGVAFVDRKYPQSIGIRAVHERNLTSDGYSNIRANVLPCQMRSLRRFRILSFPRGLPACLRLLVGRELLP